MTGNTVQTMNKPTKLNKCNAEAIEAPRMIYEGWMENHDGKICRSRENTIVRAAGSSWHGSLGLCMTFETKYFLYFASYQQYVYRLIFSHQRVVEATGGPRAAECFLTPPHTQNLLY